MKRIAAGAVLTLIFVLLFNACTVEPFDGSGNPNGSLYVSVQDDNGTAISGATLLVNGKPRTEKTPAYLHGLEPGLHKIVIKRFGFWNDTASVTIVAADTATVQRTLTKVPDGMTRVVRINSSPEGARMLLDGKTHLIGDTAEVITPSVVTLPYGEYRISAHLNGYRTASPILPLLEFGGGSADTTDFMFSLTATPTGNDSGMVPPPFILDNDSYEEVSLTDLTGHVVLVTFWYADCKPCMEEFPHIESVYRHFSADGFRVIGINPMTADKVSDIRRIRELHNISFQLVMDRNRSETTRAYNVRSFPRNIVIDRTGAIHAVRLGVTEEELTALIKSVL